jgi:hypothetical protein
VWVACAGVLAIRLLSLLLVPVGSYKALAQLLKALCRRSTAAFWWLTPGICCQHCMARHGLKTPEGAKQAHGACGISMLSWYQFHIFSAQCTFLHRRHLAV